MINNSPLVGCAIGDALGVPFEMKPASHHSLQEWDGLFKDGATFRKNNKAGQYSDDTVASICLAESLLECNGFDPENIASKYLNWFNSSDFRGMGSTTHHAISKLKYGASWKESGLTGEEFAGNGTAMRAAPIGIYFSNNTEKLVESALTDAIITHNNKEAKLGSVATAYSIAWLRLNPEKNPYEMFPDLIAILSALGSYSKLLDNLLKAKSFIENETTAETALAKIGVTGYVVHTVPAALYCLMVNDDFQNTVVMAVKAGGDADTTAAIAGALAGTYYGLENIPQVYKNQVENYDYLAELDLKLRTSSNN